MVPSNGLLVLTKSGALLIDTPWGIKPTESLLQYVEDSLNTRVTHCIVTHYHDDRTGGIPILKKENITVIAGKRTAEMLKDRVSHQPDSVLDGDEERIVVEGASVIAYYPGPGHTTDNIVVFIENEKLLFGGCFVKSIEAKDLGNIADANLAAWPASIYKVLERFDPVMTIPGHDRSSPFEESLHHTLKLLKK
jgi:metallo-beta-lactamase class B